MARLIDLPHCEYESLMFKLSEALGESGEDFAKRIDSDPGFFDRLVKFALNNGFEPSTSQVKARKIMGKNFFGVEEAIEHFGVNLTKNHLAYLAEIPFSEEVLHACRETHVLIAVMRISIMDMHSRFYNHQPAMFYSKQEWPRDKYHITRDFINDRGNELEWHLVAKTPVGDSTKKTWNEQKEMLSETNDIPTARVLIYTLIGYFLVSGERLFSSIDVRCRKFDMGNHDTCVGRFDSGGFRIYDSNDRKGTIGLASVRTQ